MLQEPRHQTVNGLSSSRGVVAGAGVPSPFLEAAARPSFLDQTAYLGGGPGAGAAGLLGGGGAVPPPGGGLGYHVNVAADKNLLMPSSTLGWLLIYISTLF